MKKVRAFLDKHVPTLVVLALVILALAFLQHYWSDPAKAQTIGALFSFIASAILVGVTWEYVRINQKSFSLQQAQWEQQNRVVLRFGVRRYRGRAQVWVANIGRIDFLISELRVRLKNGEKIVKNERRIVGSGSRRTFSLPDKLWSNIPLLSTFDVQLRYESQHESGHSAVRAFTIFIATNSEVLKVLRGIEDIWPVNCPKCGHFGGGMVTESLDNFDDALERELVMKSELQATCPEHSSQWSESVEHLRERRKNGQGTVQED